MVELPALARNTSENFYHKYHINICVKYSLLYLYHNTVQSMQYQIEKPKYISISNAIRFKINKNHLEKKNTLPFKYDELVQPICKCQCLSMRPNAQIRPASTIISVQCCIFIYSHYMDSAFIPNVYCIRNITGNVSLICITLNMVSFISVFVYSIFDSIVVMTRTVIRITFAFGLSAVFFFFFKFINSF